MKKEMEEIDLSFYLDPPELTVEGILEITALAPLSMVSSQPGTLLPDGPQTSGEYGIRDD